MKHLTFSNGDTIPAIGLGTYKILGDDVYPAIRSAIDLGYRHIDCAAMYDNEKEIGAAFERIFKDGDVKREELFITSKLWGSSLQKDLIVPQLQKTLSDLRMDYLDLYLVHWPIPLKPEVRLPTTGEDYLTQKESPLTECWAMFEGCQNMGMTRHIGVSNFNSDRIKDLQAAGLTTPEVNQVELHPFLPQEALFSFCKEHNILMEGYCPLGTPGNRPNDPTLLKNPIIQGIASKHGASTSEVILSWAVQRGTIVLPKSGNKSRQKQNLNAINLQLDNDDLQRIATLPKYRYVDGIDWTTHGSPYDLDYLWEDK